MERQAKAKLLLPLIDASTEPDSTYNIVEAPIESLQVEEDGLYPIFIIAGPRIKLMRLVRLFCFFTIILLFSVYYINTNQLLQSMAMFIAFNSTSLPGNNSDVLYLMPALLNGLPPLLSVIFGFLSDYTHYQRAYLLSYSFVFSSFSAFCLLICDLLISPGRVDLDDKPALFALIYLSVILYIIGMSMFYPISLAYGLDLLEGTKWEVKYLYFPMYYVVNNLGHLGGISYYIHFNIKSQLVIGYVIFCLMILIMILYLVFRLFQIFPVFDKRTKFDVISFRKGVEIFWNSVRVLRTGQKSPRGHWFIQLSSEVYYGKYPREQVQMVASFFEINFLLFFLFFLFSITEAMFALFPRQGYELRFLTDIHEVKCSTQEEPNGTMVNLIFINFITVVLLTPFIEYYFYKIIFFFNSSENLKAAREKKSIWRKVLKCLRCFDRYWHVYDPILKRIFWGSIFGLLSIVFALSVEIARSHIVSHGICDQPTKNFTYSEVSIRSQIPQYTLSGILEIVSYIGCLQFVYFQSNNTYKDQLKGLFFGLFYFYGGLARIICQLTYYLLSVISHSNNNNICLTHIIPCDDGMTNLSWIPLAILFIASLIVTAAFAVFAHYRHHQLSNISKRGTFLIDDEEG